MTKVELNTHAKKFAKLAHERYDRFSGEFGRAKMVYKELLSAEGHRNYPLREAKCLRSSMDLALPLGPWLERWGSLVARHPALSEEDLIVVIKQLIRGCDSQSKGWCVPNQVSRSLQNLVFASFGFMNRLDILELCKELLLLRILIDLRNLSIKTVRIS